jgi:TruD family tRNA pseudouridine synthase
MTTSSLSPFSAANFVPPNILDYFGHVCVDNAPRASIKARATDFQVEEEQNKLNILCTVSQKSDLPGGIEFPKTGRMWTVTLVKLQMTTFHARADLARRLNIDPKQITYGGLKDRWGKTGQRVNIEDIAYADLLAHCRPQELVDGRAGYFIKDPLPSTKRMRKGDLSGNKFTLRVLLPGMNAKQIEGYLTPLLQHLQEKGNLFPNAYGKQRLGVRQNTLKVGRELIENGPKAAIKLFLTDTSPNEGALATQVRGELLEMWNAAEERAIKMGETIEMQWMEWESMRSRLEPLRRKCNMTIEYDIIEKTLSVGYQGGFREVMSQMRDEFSLWVGAYQSFYFNQILSNVIAGRFIPKGRSIPLYIDDPVANRFYRKFLPEAIPTRMNRDVRDLFLTARGDGGGPWRQLFIPVQGLTGRYEDGQWFVSFSLRSGSYATTFLGTILDLEGNARVAADERSFA